MNVSISNGGFQAQLHFTRLILHRNASQSAAEKANYLCRKFDFITHHLPSCININPFFSSVCMCKCVKYTHQTTQMLSFGKYFIRTIFIVIICCPLRVDE